MYSFKKGSFIKADANVAGAMCEQLEKTIALNALQDRIRVVKTDLRQKHPGLRFHIVTGDGSTTMTRLDRGLIDFAFVYGKLDPAKYQELPLPVRDRWVLLLREDDELAPKEVIRAEDLWQASLLLSRQTLSTSTHGDELCSWLKKENARSSDEAPR